LTDHRLEFPATQRNRGAILEVLRDVLPDKGVVLEVASGSGEHVVYFAEQLPGLVFQPSDPDDANLRSIAAWTLAAGVGNVRPPMFLDAASEAWHLAADAILCINMIHISPWTATQGLLRNAARILPAGAPLYLYGPYLQSGVATAPSNQAFDESLKARNPEWGIRHLDEVTALANNSDFAGPRIVEMPANNLSVVFQRR
jgi:hypothetical protein